MDYSEIYGVCSGLEELFSPHKIFVYGEKFGFDGKARSFDICLVTDTEDKLALVKEAYEKVDCDCEYDLHVYTVEEFTRLLKDEGSYAARIVRIGHEYGKR